MEQDQARYIVRYYSHLMSTEEKFAYTNLNVQLKSAHASPSMQAHLSQLLSDNPEAVELAKDGLEAFEQQAAGRILEVHGNTVILNYCPRCGKLAKTPKARQCRFCFHDWHD